MPAVKEILIQASQTLGVRNQIYQREKSLTFQPTLRLPNLTVLTMRDYSAGMKIRREQVIYNFPQLADILIIFEAIILHHLFELPNR